MEGYIEVDEAARRLGVTPGSVRRALREYYYPKEDKPKDKGLRGEMLEGGKRGRWLVKEDSLKNYRHPRPMKPRKTIRR
jgi:hypothetical protein